MIHSACSVAGTILNALYTVTHPTLYHPLRQVLLSSSRPLYRHIQRPGILPRDHQLARALGSLRICTLLPSLSVFCWAAHQKRSSPSQLWHTHSIFPNALVFFKWLLGEVYYESLSPRSTDRTAPTLPFKKPYTLRGLVVPYSSNHHSPSHAVWLTVLAKALIPVKM